MAKRVRKSGSKLLRELTSGNSLQAYLGAQNTQQLYQLIATVGLEDSHALVHGLDNRQIGELLSVDVWRAPQPGAEEELDIHRLCTWIEVWGQDGEEYLSRRLVGIGFEFLVLTFAEMLLVEEVMGSTDPNSMTFGEYTITSRVEGEWSRMLDACAALWRYEPDLLIKVLRSASSDDGADVRLTDAKAKRVAKRQSEGYVAPTDAAVFLTDIKTRSADHWNVDFEYCAIARDYLQPPPGSEDLSAARSSDQADIDAAGSATSELDVADAEPHLDEIERQKFDALLVDGGVKERTVPLQIAGPADSSTAANLVQQALGVLARHHPELLSQRVAELAFLSNVLMSGSEIQGAPFSQRMAADAVSALANLGLSKLLSTVQASATEELLLEYLTCEAGMLVPFRIGYYEISQISKQTVDAVYRAKDIQSRRRGHVAFLHMAEVLGEDTLRVMVQESRYEEAKLLVDGLTVAVDSAACVTLRILLDPIPCLPRVLEPGTSRERMFVNKRYRFINCIEDLGLINSFLDNLPDYCGT